MEFKYTSGCSKDQLRDIRTFVADVMIKVHADEMEAHEITLAVDEICANLMIHSHNCNPSETIQLHLTVSNQGKMIIEIIDRGVGFDISKYREPTLETVVRNRKKGGIGLMLVKRIMDKIEFVKAREENICRLYKQLKVK